MEAINLVPVEKLLTREIAPVQLAALMDEAQYLLAMYCISDPESSAGKKQNIEIIFYLRKLRDVLNETAI